MNFPQKVEVRVGMSGWGRDVWVVAGRDPRRGGYTDLEVMLQAKTLPCESVKRSALKDRGVSFSSHPQHHILPPAQLELRSQVGESERGDGSGQKRGLSWEGSERRCRGNERRYKDGEEGPVHNNNDKLDLGLGMFSEQLTQIPHSSSIFRGMGRRW